MSFIYIQIMALSAIKFSALFFYHRIFRNPTGRCVFDTVNITSMVIVGLWTIAMLILNTLQCGTHLSARWTNIEGYVKWCVNKHAGLYTEIFSLSNVLLDVWILAIPLPKVFKPSVSSILLIR